MQCLGIALNHLLGNVRITPGAVQKRHQPGQHISVLGLAQHIMTVSTIVNVRVRLANLLFGDAKALHVGNMGAIGFDEGAFDLTAQKADLFKRISLLQNRR